MHVRGHRLSQQQRGEIISLSAKGKSYREVIEAMGCSSGAIARVLIPLGGVPVKEWSPGPNQLTLDERIEIRRALDSGSSQRHIARELGRAPSTISREVAHNGGAVGYSPRRAHERARECARRPKVCKLAAADELTDRVVHYLERLWSPEQISAQLRIEFPDRPEMWVSHETIYKYLYVQGRGELRRELAACLRTGRAKRKPRGRIEKRGRSPTW